MVLFLDNQIVATSTAAGPCFEGVTISSGMRASVGAIEHVRLGEELFVTVHPHLNLPHQGGGIQGNNEYSPPLAGGVRGGSELSPISYSDPLKILFYTPEGRTLAERFIQIDLDNYTPFI